MFKKGMIVDRASTHENKISEKKLDAPAFSGYNHIAAFIMWGYRNNYLNPEFLAEATMLKDALENNKDIRQAIRFDKAIKGELCDNFFIEEVRNFIRSYYRFNRQGYPHDVDINAKNYLGASYDDPIYQNEGYLFLPYDDNYLENMASYIDTAVSHSLLNPAYKEKLDFFISNVIATTQNKIIKIVP